MKLYANRPQDHVDLAAIWDQTTFTDGQQAAAAFEAGYPHLEHDPYLASFIAGVVRGSS